MTSLDLHIGINVDDGAMSTTDTKAPVTVIGLGLMGRSLARALLQAGHPTTVWNRTAGKADALIAEGAGFARTVGDALAANPLAIICLTDYDAVAELMETGPGALSGTTLVNLTSGSSAQAREATRWSAQHGAGYLDGAIMAIPSTIGTPEALILLSGASADFEAHHSTLGALGVATYVGADHGLASLYDAGGLAMMWSILNAWLQGTALLETAGVDAATYATFAQQMAAGVATWLPGYADQIDNGSFPASVSTLATDARAMGHLVEESETLGVSAELPKLIKAMADRAVAAGDGDAAYPVMIREFRGRGTW